MIMMDKPTARIKQKKLPAAPYPKTPVLRPKPREPEGIPIRLIGRGDDTTSREIMSVPKIFEEKKLIRMLDAGESYEAIQERFGLSREALSSWIGRLKRHGKYPRKDKT